MAVYTTYFCVGERLMLTRDVLAPEQIFLNM